MTKSIRRHYSTNRVLNRPILLKVAYLKDKPAMPELGFAKLEKLTLTFCPRYDC
jgi:hypothetical protein